MDTKSQFANSSFLGKSRFALIVATAIAATAFVTGCSSNSASEQNPSASASEASPSSSPTEEVVCSAESVRTVIPKEYKILNIQCSAIDGINWAIVSTNPGPEVFFLKDEGGKWNPMKASDVCGTASAGLPAELLVYCPGA